MTTRFGFLVSKRVGGAVIRNRARRRLREILRCEAVTQGWDLVLIARPKIARASFAEVQSSIRDVLRRGGLAERISKDAMGPGGQR
jgi:ribonuclease P protein component